MIERDNFLAHCGAGTARGGAKPDHVLDAHRGLARGVAAERVHR